jgi:hypothetical protein
VNSNQASARPAAPAAVLPGPWQTRDIGGVAAAGSASWANGTFLVTGSGEDIYGALDEFRYVYQAAIGDCEIKARVFAVQNTDPWAEAGVMIRETLNSNAKKVATHVTFSNVTFQRRSSTGGLTYYSRTTGSPRRTGSASCARATRSRPIARRAGPRARGPRWARSR